jgi:hypothetical protein
MGRAERMMKQAKIEAEARRLREERARLLRPAPLTLACRSAFAAMAKPKPRN